MILSNIWRNIVTPRIIQTGKVFLSQRGQIVKKWHLIHNKNFTSSTSCNVQVTQRRCYNSNPEENSTNSSSNIELHPLLDDEIIMVPGIIKTWQNLYYHKMQVPKIAPDFNVVDFMQASKQAVEVVSRLLSKENYEALEDLLTADLIQKLRQKIMTLSSDEKELIRVNQDDIYAFFPYNIQVVSNGTEDWKNMLEIYMVYYSHRGLKELMTNNKSPSWDLSVMTENPEKTLVCNYRFTKDYTHGVDAPWIINLCNHVTLSLCT